MIDVEHYIKLNLMMGVMFVLLMMMMLCFIITDGLIFHIRLHRLKLKAQAINIEHVQSNTHIQQLAHWWNHHGAEVNNALAVLKDIKADSIVSGERSIKVMDASSVAVPSHAPAYCRYYNINYTASFMAAMGVLRSLSLLPNNIYIQKVMVGSGGGALMVQINMGICNVT